MTKLPSIIVVNTQIWMIVTFIGRHELLLFPTVKRKTFHIRSCFDDSLLFRMLVSIYSLAEQISCSCIAPERHIIIFLSQKHTHTHTRRFLVDWWCAHAYRNLFLSISHLQCARFPQAPWLLFSHDTNISASLLFDLLERRCRRRGWLSTNFITDQNTFVLLFLRHSWPIAEQEI